MNRRICIGRNGAALLLAAVLTAGCADKPETLVASAKEHLAKNDRAAAVIQLRNALQKNPDLAEARYLLGKSLLETGDLAGAEKELRKASELGYPADVVAPLLARLVVRRGDYKKAIDEFGNATIGSPAQKADLQTTIAQAYMGLGNGEAARNALAAALAAQPDYPPALVGQARLMAAGGDLPGALALVETALTKTPTLTDGWQLKGDVLLAQRQIDPALAAYRSALETKPDQVLAHYMIVTLLMQTGRTEEARKELAAMQKVLPKNPQTLYLKALFAVREKDYAGARDAIQLHLKAAPNSMQGLLLGAQIDYQLGSYVQAESTLQSVLQQVPNHQYARRLLVQSYLREGKPAKALDAMKPLLDAAQQDSDTMALAGEVYVQNGDTTTAAQYFEKAAALDPKSPGKRTAAALSHLAKGERERGLGELEAVAAEDTGIRADLALLAVNVRQRKFDAALAAVAAIEKKQPDKPLAHDLRGSVLLAKRDVAGARRSFERALAIDPTYFPAAANLARLDLLEKKPEDATKRFDAILAKDPKNVQALVAIAGLRAQAGGSTDEVAAMIAKAVEANPSELSPRLALILHYLRAKEPKKAVAAAQDALAALPDRPEILDAAGQAYKAADDTSQAITIYNKLVQLRPDSPVPYLRLAELQMAIKDNTAAIENLRKVLAIKPDLVEAQRAIIALDISSGRTDDALAAARDVQKRRPKESIGYILEGNVYVSKKAWSEAATAYRAGLKQVGTTDLAISLHSVLIAAGKGSEADSFAATWVKEHPKDRGFRLNLAQIALGKKDYAGAARQYKAMLELEPGDALVLNNLAWAAGELKDPKALEYAERADKLAPDNPQILDTLGTLLVEKGDTARGVESLRKAIAIAPDAASIRLNLARALVKSGQKDAAKKELETLAKLGDKFPRQAEVARLAQTL